MTDVQAAIGLHQLRNLPNFHRRRKDITARYDRAFREFDELETPVERGWAGHAWHLYVLRLRLDRLTISRDEFVTELGRRNIGTSAVCLLIRAGTLANNRDIFVLDMGPPVLIDKLAEDLIELSGLCPNRDVRIEITGLKRGEKISQVLMDGTSELCSTQLEKVKAIGT